jgi:hypothetical protein
LTGAFGDLLNVLSIIGTGLAVVELACATNPATIVFSAVTLVLNGIIGIFSTITNIIAIGKLNQTKEDLIRYFAPGGEFERAQIKLKESAIQVTKNLYLLIVNGKNLLKMLSARILLIQLQGSTELDYGSFLTALQEDPFDIGFEKSVINSYMNLVQIGHDKISLPSQINKMYTVLSAMMKAHDIEQKLRQFTSILRKFTADQPIATIIEREYASLD